MQDHKHTISIPITAVPKPRMTQRDRWALRPAVARYRDFCDELRLHMPTYELPGELYITFFMPMPASWSNKKRMAMLGAPHQQKPDVDNLCKSFMDAWKTDDSHVYLIQQRSTGPRMDQSSWRLTSPLREHPFAGREGVLDGKRANAGAEL